MLKRHLQDLCPLYSCSIQSPPYNPPLESKKCMPTFELDIGEQMCQAKVFVCEFTAEDFEEVPHIPSCSIHIIMNFSLANIRWFFMDHYFLNNESHAWKKNGRHNYSDIYTYIYIPFLHTTQWTRLFQKINCCKACLKIHTLCYYLYLKLKSLNVFRKSHFFSKYSSPGHG